MANTVTLVAPDGSGKVTVDSAAAVNNLVYGMGYKIEGKQSVADAVASLSDQPETKAEVPSKPKA